jgi:anti-sigma factor RsiW
VCVRLNRGAFNSQAAVFKGGGIIMNCKEIRELFEEYIFGELSDEMGMQIEAHIDGCAECKREYENLKESIAGIRDAYDSMDVPDELSKTYSC